MEIDIKVGSGPEELVKGKQLLAEKLKTAWTMMQQDPSLDPLVITFKFGEARESWFQLGANDSGDPVLSYADKDHLAILFPLKDVISQFLTINRSNPAAPFVLKQYFCDIDEQLRLAKTMAGGGSYPEASPKSRLEAITPQAAITRQKEQLPTVMFELEASEKSPGQFSIFSKTETHNKSEPKPVIAPIIKGPTHK